MINEHRRHFAKLNKAPILSAMLVGVCILANYAFPASAQAQTRSCNFSEPIVNCDLSGGALVEDPGPSCPGGGNDSINTLTIKNGALHVTQRPDGTVRFTVTIEGPYSQVPLDGSSVPTCIGHYAGWEGYSANTNAQPGCQIISGVETCPGQSTGDFVMSCTDGESFDAEATFFPLVVNGQLKLHFQSYDCHPL